MTIVDELKKLIEQKGGSAVGVMTIADAVKVLTDLEAAANPLAALTVDKNVGSSVLGKLVSALQKDIEFTGSKITGTLKYVTGYTGYSSDPKLQSGNYLAVHASVPDVDDVTITVYLTGALVRQTVTLDEDGILVIRVADNVHQRVTFTATKEGEVPYSVTYLLSGLTVEPAPEE